MQVIKPEDWYRVTRFSDDVTLIDAPLKRRYWEVVTGDGRDLVVFRDLLEGRWYGQR